MQGVGVEWQDFNLPIPNYLKHNNMGYHIGWQIDGYFATRVGIEYLNDMIGRILITFRENEPKRLPWSPNINTADHYYPKIRKLQSLQNLKSKPSRSKAPTRADSFDDYAFWAIKLYTEDRIREQGEGVMIAYELIEDWAMSQFENNKERSTIRAKCRSVWAWYDNKNWELPKGRTFEMTRSERAKSNALAKSERAKRKVINATSGLMANEYKTKTGKWNISKIAKELNMSRDTVRKHLKEKGLI
jgi:AraC-like DNA-binding protein